MAGTRKRKITNTLSNVSRIVINNPVRRFQLSMVTLVILVGGATLGYILIESMPFTDALYMTIITMTTVGFGETQPLSPAGRLFTIGVILVGVGAATTAISNAVGIVLGPRLWLSIRLRNMERLLMTLENHHIVCGYGRMGRQVIDDLKRRGEPFVLIDQNPEAEEMLLAEDIPFVIGDATRDETLQRAGIERASGLVAALNTDPDNVMTVLTARELNPRLFIVARVGNAEAESKLRRAGANQVVSPYQIGGHRIALALLRPAVNDFLDSIFHFEHGIDVDIGQIYVRPDTRLAGQTVAGSDLRRTHHVNILAMQTPQRRMVMTPDPDTMIEAGSTLIVIGAPEHIYELERLYPRNFQRG